MDIDQTYKLNFDESRPFLEYGFLRWECILKEPETKWGNLLYMLYNRKAK